MIRRVLRVLDALHGRLGRLVSWLEACACAAACEDPRACAADNLCPSCWRHREEIQP